MRPVIGFWLLAIAIWFPFVGIGYCGDLDKPVDRPVTEELPYGLCFV